MGGLSMALYGLTHGGALYGADPWGGGLSMGLSCAAPQGLIDPPRELSRLEGLSMGLGGLSMGFLWG